MKNLIIYSTKYGSVGHAAEMLKSKLEGEVEMINITIDAVPDLKTFDAIIIGGSIYLGKIQKTIYKFMTSNLQLLLTKRIGLFICAGIQDIETLASELHDNFPQELFDHAIAKDVFGYEIQMEKLNFAERFAVKKILKANDSISALSDENIAKFAAEIVFAKS